MEVRILVKPGSSRGDKVEETPDGLVVYLHAKAVDGAANAALVNVLAKHYDVPKTRVHIKRGAVARHKTIVID
ncbi:MAG: DUF167 domain-containing protein [Candidatus Nomurabacteria bacterium]|jgi:uncharacterized protein YggU (UPF0235/DUF167 family)|nr:DUF167 domain-containing protein [Candidatus Nomurabacteria bacterium]